MPVWFRTLILITRRYAQICFMVIVPPPYYASVRLAIYPNLVRILPVVKQSKDFDCGQRRYQALRCPCQLINQLIVNYTDVSLYPSFL